MYTKLNFNDKIFSRASLFAGIFFICFSAFAQTPYNIVMNLYGDTDTQMSFNWLCDPGGTSGKVEIIGVNPVTATCTQYSGFTRNEAVVTGLSPNTTYSFKVCNNNSCSSTGTFTTAKTKGNKDPFSFVYLTDSQVPHIDTLIKNANAVFQNCPNTKFWIHCGDLVWHGELLNEWKDFFNAQQYWFLRKPFAPVIGNHDRGGTNNTNFKHHFNIDNFGTSDIYGSTYTYIYGDAQFFGINGELYWDNITYIPALTTWMQNQINANPNIKWRIVYFHKSAYTGTALQTDGSTKQWRDNIVQHFDALNIDLVLFGHDHVYQVIGPVKNKKIVQGAVSNLIPDVPPDTSNRTGVSKGIFNVKEGTLYFCNGHIGWHAFYPLQLTSMQNSSSTGISDYPSLFTGRLAQPGKSTYSNVSVSTDNIVITTYKINNGNSQFYDEIKIVKYCEPYTQGKVEYNTTQTFNNTTLIIGEELRIKNNATVTFKNSTLRFHEKAKVTIEPGSKLVIDGTTLTNSCPDKIWYGILVSGNSLLPQTAQNQGTLELKNGAVIENARNAIATYELNADGGINWDNKSGGIIRAENATFKNNRRSVEFMAYAYTTGGLVYQNVSYFRNCKFIVDDNNLFAANHVELINQLSMWEVTGVKIQGCTFENNITNMPDRKRAIYTEDAGYTVDEICTVFPVYGCECGTTPTRSVFKGFNKAIESSSSVKQYAIRIDHSDFRKNITGVRFDGKNSFQLSRLDMVLDPIQSGFPFGIYLNTCLSDYKVEDNTIYSNVNNLATGILAYKVGTNENRIYRNKINNTYYGIAVANSYLTYPATNPNVNRSHPATGLQFVCNNFSGNTNDIYVYSDAQIRFLQGFSDSGADNVFGLPRATCNFHLGGQLPIIYYYDYSNPVKEPVNRTSNIALLNGSSNTCVSTLCGYEVSFPETWDGKSDYSYLEKYRNANRIYNEMIHIFHEKGYDKVLNDYSAGIIKFEDLLEEVLPYIETMSAISEYMAELSREALMALKTDSIIDLNQIRDWYDEINTLSAKYSLAETYYQLGRFEDGIHTLRLIPEMFHLNEEETKEHNNYFSLFMFKNQIRESGRNIAQLSEEEIEQMLQFAYNSNGLSSVMAQGILCFHYDICLEGEIYLTEEQTSKKAEKQNVISDVQYAIYDNQKSKIEDITLIPNPTTGQLTINSGQLTIKNVELFDIYGRKVCHSLPINCYNKLDISILPNGLYFVRITTEEGIVMKKIIKN